MSWTIVIPRTPISQNSKEWREKWHRAKYKATWEREIWALCKEQKIPPLLSVRLFATVYFPDQRLRDLDNFFPALYKPTQDALIAAGIIPGDDTRYIPELPGLRFDFDKDNPRTEVTITQLE